jgi:hypothetical protein
LCALNIRAFTVIFQSFFLNIENKTTFLFPIKNHPINSFPSPFFISIKYYLFTLSLYDYLCERRENLFMIIIIIKNATKKYKEAVAVAFYDFSEIFLKFRQHNP